jgi:hypothetical protein
VQFLDQLRGVGEQLEDLQRGPSDGGSDGVGEEVWARSLSEEVDDGFGAGSVAASRPAESLAECGVDDVDLLVHATVLRSASPSRP